MAYKRVTISMGTDQLSFYLSTPLKPSAPSWPRWRRPSKSPISPEPSGGRRSSLARRALRKNVDNLARSFRVGAPFGRGRMTPVSREPRVVRLRSNASRRSFVAAKPLDRSLSPENARKAAFSSGLDYRSISKGFFAAFSTTRSLFYVLLALLPLSTGVEAPFGDPTVFLRNRSLRRFVRNPGDDFSTLRSLFFRRFAPKALSKPCFRFLTFSLPSGAILELACHVIYRFLLLCLPFRLIFRFETVLSLHRRRYFQNRLLPNAV